MIPGIMGILGTGESPSSGINFVAVGTIDNEQGAGPLTPSYPAGIANGDIAILTVLVTDSTSSPGAQTATTADGTWTLIQAIPRTTIPSIVSAYGAQYWKRLDGTETGTVQVDLSETNNTGCSFADISVWRGCVASGTPLEAATYAVEGSTSTQTSSSINTLGANRKVIAHFMSAPDSPAATVVGPAVEEYTDTHLTAGLDSHYGCYSLDAPTSGSYSISRTLDVADGDITATLALIAA